MYSLFNFISMAFTKAVRIPSVTLIKATNFSRPLMHKESQEWCRRWRSLAIQSRESKGKVWKRYETYLNRRHKSLYYQEQEQHFPFCYQTSERFHLPHCGPCSLWALDLLSVTVSIQSSQTAFCIVFFLSFCSICFTCVWLDWIIYSSHRVMQHVPSLQPSVFLLTKMPHLRWSYGPTSSKPCLSTY